MLLDEFYEESEFKNWGGVLLKGNNTEIIKQIPNNSFDLTVTSPPYDNLREYKSGCCFDFETLAKELYRVTKEGGVVVWIVGDATIDGDETLTSFKQALYFKEVGFKCLDTMIYEKNGCGACGSDKCYIQNFEYMFVFTKGKIKTHNLFYDRVNKIQGKMTVNGHRTLNNADNERKYRDIVSKNYGKRFNIWKYNQTDGHDDFSKKHPAPFPQQLAEDHIISWSNENDIVFDPFMGSGTTAKMAFLNNRKWFGIELDDDYCKIIKDRFENMQIKNVNSYKSEILKKIVKNKNEVDLFEM